MKLIRFVFGILSRRIAKLFATFATFAVFAAACGCSRALVIDVRNGDVYGYSVAPWETEAEEDAAARARYYAWGARTQYTAGTRHTLVIELVRCGETNAVKRAEYVICGERE